MEKNAGIETKLQLLFTQLHSLPDFPIEDDTVLQKLQSSLQGLIDCHENSLTWGKKIGIVSFVENSLEESYIRNEKNSTLASFALYCLSSLVRNEQRFISLSHEKVMRNFQQCFPYVSENMSSLANTIKVVETLISHQAGLKWVIANDVWENLLRSLYCPNIFIKKSCTTAITNIILKVEDEEKFAKYIQDLEMILISYQETKVNLSAVEDVPNECQSACNVAKLEGSSQTILFVFQNILTEALGKKCLYTPLKTIFELISKILFHFDTNVLQQQVITFSRFLLLGTIHKFQELIFQCKKMEQSHLDSLASDMLSLARSMITKKWHKEFIIASFEFYKNWSTFCKNIGEQISLNEAKLESVLMILTKVQVFSLRATCRKFSMGMETDEEKKFKECFKIWKSDILQYVVINNEQKIELDHLFDILLENSSSDLHKINEQCISCLMCFSSTIEYLHLMCASYAVKSLIFLLQFKIDETIPLESDSRLYLHAIDVLNSFIERYEINWNTYEADLLFPALCTIVEIPGITTRVKVVSLQGIKTCVEKCIPPLKAQLNEYSFHAENIEGVYLNSLEKATNRCLSDTEWEVRDSALELILSCMKVSKEHRKVFIDWFLKLNLLNHVLQTVGDIEPYVQATALHVLASLVGVEKIWCKVNEKEMKQIALRAIVRSGELCIRNGGVVLLHSLLVNSKFMQEEIYKFILPVVQSTTSEEDDDIRISAISIIHHHLNMELDSIGIGDGKSFLKACSYYDDETADLEDKELKCKILNVISSFCRNGNFVCVVNSLDDNVEAVSSEATVILKFVDSLLSKYSLHSELYSQLLVDNTASPLPMIEGDAAYQVNSRENELSSIEESNPDIEYILKMSDLTAISKLKKEDSSNDGKFWWNGEASEAFLVDEEIPLNSNIVSEDWIIKGLKKAYHVKIGNGQEVFENEINLLLEDIFLVVGSSKVENESRARDCY